MHIEANHAERHVEGDGRGAGGPEAVRRGQLELLSRAVTREAHVLAREPRFLASHLHNVLALGDDGAAESLLARSREALGTRAWLRLANRPRLGAGRDAALRTLPAAGASSHLAWSPDAELLAHAGGRIAEIWSLVSGEVVAHLEGSVGPVAWSPDGALLASSSGGHALRLWDRFRGPSTVMRGHTADVRRLAWSPDGRILASGGDDHTVRLWTRSGTPLALLADHAAQVFSLAWSPDGDLLASGSDDNTVRLWSPDGSPVAMLKERMDRVLALAWSPGGGMLATAGWDATVRLWDRDGWGIGAALEGGDAWTLAWSPDGQLLAFSAHGTVRLWDATTGAVERVLAGHAGRVHALEWSPGGDVLASGGADGAVRLWDREGATRGLLAGHVNWATELAWSPDGSVLASGGLDDTVRLWDPSAAPGEATHGRLGEVHAVAWSPDGTLLASGGEDGAPRLWATTDASLAAVLEGHSGPIRRVAWSSDGSRLASAGSNPYRDERHAVRLWDRAGEPLAVLEGHARAVADISWSPDGALLASAGGDGSVRVWTSHGRCLGVAPAGHDTQVLSLSWCPGSACLAFGDVAGWVHLLRATASRIDPVAAWPAHAGRVLDLSWSPDGTVLATASDDDNAVRLWRRDGTSQAAIDIGRVDLGSEMAHSTILTHKLGVRMAWSPDSQVLATASMDPVVRLWNREGALLAVMAGHTEQVWAIAWLPDGSGLVSGGADGAIRLWSVRSGECSAAARSFSPVLALEVDAGGKVVRVADDGSATARQPVPYVFELCNVDAGTLPRPVASPAPVETAGPGAVVATADVGREAATAGLAEEPEGPAEPDDPGFMSAPPSEVAAWLGRRTPARREEPAEAEPVPAPKTAPVPDPGPAVTLAALLAASGLRSEEYGGGHVLFFAAGRTDGVVLQARELPGGLVGVYVGLPELRRRKERAYRTLLQASFEACYAKAFRQDSGALVLAAEVPLASLDPASLAGVCVGLAALGDVTRDDLEGEAGLRSQLAVCALAQAQRISLEPEREIQRIEGILGRVARPSYRLGSGLLVTSLSLVGRDLQCVVRALPTCLSFIVSPGGVRPEGEEKLGRLLGLNRADVAKVGLDPDGELALLYEVPAVDDDLLEDLDSRLTPLLLGVWVTG